MERKRAMYTFLLIILLIYAVVLFSTIVIREKEAEKEANTARHLIEEGSRVYINGEEREIPPEAIDSNSFKIKISQDKNSIFLYVK